MTRSRRLHSSGRPLQPAGARRRRDGSGRRDPPPESRWMCARSVAG